MSITTINALPALASLTSGCARLRRYHDRRWNRPAFSCAFRRSSIDDIPGLAELVAAGVPLKVKTGSAIHHFDGKEWSVRKTAKHRHNVVVDAVLL